MKLLIPLGLLGLIGIAVLFLIYILKPNYQNRVVSSTFVWKLSIKYKKKRLPISRLRNILLIICQILVIVSCAMILAKPAQVLMEKIDQSEVVIIIDSSASMRTGTADESRYLRAVDQASDFADEVFSRNGIVSVIIADRDPEFLNLNTDGDDTVIPAMRISSDKKSQLNRAFNVLREGETACSYGTADMDETIALCSSVVDLNPDARIYFYTDAEYAYVPEGINTKNVSDSSEWNASIINAYSELQDNHYSFFVEVACYGRAEEVKVKLQIQGMNTEDKSERVPPVDCYGSVFCTEDKIKTIIFSDRDLNDLTDYEKQSEDVVFVSLATPVTSYQSVHVSLELYDSLVEDNDYDIYNGLKEILNVQYASTLTNPFINSALDTVRSNFADRWDVRISEIRDGNYALSGFDFYIFEHAVPSRLPTDGVVFIIDPDQMPSDLMSLGGYMPYKDHGLFLSAGDEHPITNYIQPDYITVSLLRVVTSYDTAHFKVAMYCENHPALLIKDERDAKVVVMPFSLHYSNVAILPYLSVLISNMFVNFLPSTVSGSVFDVYEDISLNCRGSELSVSYNGEEENTYDTFPATFNPKVIGTYLLKQETFGGKKIEDSIYVRIPASECNIWKVEDSLKNPFVVHTYGDYYNDLLLYFAIALVSLLFFEWLLQMRENV